MSLRLFLTCLIAFPAVFGLFLPRPIRWLLLVASAAIVCALLATGINVHGASALVFALTVGAVAGMLVVELATELARLSESSRRSPAPGPAGNASE